MKFAKPDIFILYTGQEVVKLLKDVGFSKAHYWANQLGSLQWAFVSLQKDDTIKSPTGQEKF